MGQPPAEPEPVIDGRVILGDRDEAGEAGLGREQVVVRSVARAGARLVPDREQGPRLVVEEAEVHLEGVVVGAIRQRPEASHQVRRGRGPRGEAAPRLRSGEASAVAPDEGRQVEVTEPGRGLGDQAEAPVDPLGRCIRGARGGRGGLDGVAGLLKGRGDAVRERARRRGLDRRGESVARGTELLLGGGHGSAPRRRATGVSRTRAPGAARRRASSAVSSARQVRPSNTGSSRDAEAGVPESDQVPGQVAAIDRRDVPGLEDPELARGRTSCRSARGTGPCARATA